MSIALNKAKLDNLADEIWKSAERLRGKFKACEYQSVILPIIVIRRLECVLVKWRADKMAEVLPNKFFCRYEPPTPAKDLLAEFWRLEKEAEKMLEGLAQ